MLAGVRHRRAAILAALTTLLLIPATGFADSVASTGDATAVTTHSAILNGVVNTTNPNSQWAFQYGTTTAYGTLTPPQPIGVGSAAVSQKVAGLTPGRTYHYRLVVEQGAYPTTYSAGADRTFTAPHQFGTLSLRGHQLRVSHRKVTIPLSCKGNSGVCRGTIRITLKHGHLSCAGGHFSLRAGKLRKLKKVVRGGCLKLLGKAQRHSLAAHFQAFPAGPQGQLLGSVRLFE
ncbi:MAG: hypothetical protein JOZ73_10510 [Solirubrobacterales bacterium]|nr:hypothetical protein [Solirubrobacterales bacterium]